jgi:hypothetical protein
MTREQKIEKRKARAKKRYDKRNNGYRALVQEAQMDGVPVAAIKHSGYSWQDSNSPTGYTQRCSYIGTCQSPCNGDC